MNEFKINIFSAYSLSLRHIANKNRNAIKLSKILVATAMMPLAGAILKTFITNAITGKRLIPYHIM